MPGSLAGKAAESVSNYFTMSRSFEGIWDIQKANYDSEFVELVEEQRSKAA